MHYMLKMSVVAILIMSLYLILPGCFGGGPRALYPQPDGKGTVAAVSFSLDNPILEEGTEKDAGPGLLQKKERYFERHAEEVECMWEQLKENIAAAFDNAPFMRFDEIGGNAIYTELTSYPSKKSSGGGD